MQKHTLLLFVAFFIFMNSSFSQELKTELYFTPISIQSNKITETGTSIGEFNLENTHTYEVGVQLEYKLKNNFGFGIGVNYNQINYKFDYLLVEPNRPFTLYFSRTNFTNNALGISPTLFYEFKKLSFALSYEFNSIISNKGEIMNHKDAELGRSYNLNLSYSRTDDISHSFSEEARVPSNNQFYSMPKLIIGYKLSNKFTVFGGLKYKILGDRVIYNIDVTSEGGTPSAKEYNVKVINQPLFIQVGLSYDIKIK